MLSGFNWTQLWRGVVIHRFDAGIPKLPALAVFHYFIYGVGEFCVGIGIEIVSQGEQPDGYLSSVVSVHRLPLHCWDAFIVA